MQATGWDSDKNLFPCSTHDEKVAVKRILCVHEKVGRQSHVCQINVNARKPQSISDLYSKHGSQLKRWTCSCEPMHATLLSTACPLCCFQLTFVKFLLMSVHMRSPLGYKDGGILMPENDKKRNNVTAFSDDFSVSSCFKSNMF